MSTMRVVLADNHLLFRKGLARLLDGQPDFEVVGEAQDGIEASQMTRRMRPDLVLMDNRLPVCDGPETTRRIKLRSSDVLVVILGVPETDDDLVRAIRLGADGYLLKDILPEELFRHLRGLRDGMTPLSPALIGPLVRQIAQLSRVSPPSAPRPSLSSREMEVLRLIVEGMTNPEIALQLAIAPNTVKNHVRSILRKLGARNRSHAAALAVAQGLVAGQTCSSAA